LEAAHLLSKPQSCMKMLSIADAAKPRLAPQVITRE